MAQILLQGDVPLIGGGTLIGLKNLKGVLFVLYRVFPHHNILYHKIRCFFLCGDRGLIITMG